MAKKSGVQTTMTRAAMLEVCEKALEANGWRIEHVPGANRSVRVLYRGKETRIVSLRTSRDAFISFTRSQDDTGWDTLSEVEAVVLVAISEDGKSLKVFDFEAQDMLDRFNRAYDLRKAGGLAVEAKRGLWLPLYIPENGTPNYTGCGAGINAKPIAEYPLPLGGGNTVVQVVKKLTIAEAKQGLAAQFGVSPECIQITINA